MSDDKFSSHGAGVHMHIDGLDAMVKGFTDAMNMKHYTPLVKEYTIKTAQTTHKLMNLQYTGHYEWSKDDHKLVKVMPTGTTRRSTLAHMNDPKYPTKGWVIPQQEHYEVKEDKGGMWKGRRKKAKYEEKLRGRYIKDASDDEKKAAGAVPGQSYFADLEFGTRKMKARPTLGPAFELRSKQFEKALDERFATWARHKHF
ncbi:hypothetical protein [Lactobacillus kitasatonis]|uniref:hypothetical protein n=1 Tax=Lactobacillus kitasatonis TaxID=237446 RepID=UPI003F67702F